MKTKSVERRIKRELRGFDNWLQTNLEYEYYHQKKLKIPDDLKKRIKKTNDWFNNLSHEAYMSLIG